MSKFFLTIVVQIAMCAPCVFVLLKKKTAAALVVSVSDVVLWWWYACLVGLICDAEMYKIARLREQILSSFNLPSQKHSSLAAMITTTYETETVIVRHPTVVNIPGQGSVRGVSDEDRSLIRFLNIPYAVVTERWRHASPVKPWLGVRDATHYG